MFLNKQPTGCLFAGREIVRSKGHCEIKTEGAYATGDLVERGSEADGAFQTRRS